MHPLTLKAPPAQDLRVPAASVGLRAEAAKPAAVAPLELRVAAADAEKRAAADLAAVSAVVYVAVSKAELDTYVSQQCRAFSQYSPPPSHLLRAVSLGRGTYVSLPILVAG